MRRIVALVCFVLAVGMVIVVTLAASSLVQEYGPAEGYGNLALQSLPIVALGMGVSGLLIWTGVRLLRRNG